MAMISVTCVTRLTSIPVGEEDEKKWLTNVDNEAEGAFYFLQSADNLQLMFVSN